MPGPKKRTNPVLFLAVLLLCLLFGAILSRSSAEFSPASSGSAPDTFVAKDADDPASLSEGTVTDNNKTDDSQSQKDTPQPTATPVPTKAPKKEKTETAAFEVSPEASKGVWTPNGSSWMFLVDGTPYTGWLTDTDQHRYYFDQDGIMQTGWLDDDGKRYYLDLDGIMQTGTVKIGKETYEFLQDGSLKDYVPETTPEPEKKKESKKKSSSKKRKTIALTFDDGPSSFTGRLLDCLESNNAKATFFLVGEEASYFQEEVKRIDSLGCELGNHTYSHANLTELDQEGITSQISRTDQLLTELTGHGSTALRPPYGAINDTVVSSVTTPMFLWSVDTRDWETLDAQQTIDTVLSEAKDGAIILMHDIYSQTVDAAEVIIPKLIEQSYELVTVHELAEAHGIELQAGIAYGDLTGNTTTE